MLAGTLKPRVPLDTLEFGSRIGSGSAIADIERLSNRKTNLSRANDRDLSGHLCQSPLLAGVSKEMAKPRMDAAP